MPTFFATSRIVVRAKPIFWKSWSDTSRIFFFVASFLDSRRPMSFLLGYGEGDHHQGGAQGDIREERRDQEAEEEAGLAEKEPDHDAEDPQVDSAQPERQQESPELVLGGA